MANVTSRMPTPHDERVFGIPAVSFHPDRQRHKPRVADGQTDQNRPKPGMQVAWVVVRSKDGLPAFPQCHQIVVRLASQCLEIDVLEERLNIGFSRNGILQSDLVHPCWTLVIAVDLGPKLADHPQLTRVRRCMDIKTLDILVRAPPPVL
jgi:hypothetical protein